MSSFLFPDVSAGPRTQCLVGSRDWDILSSSWLPLRESPPSSPHLPTAAALPLPLPAQLPSTPAHSPLCLLRWEHPARATHSHDTAGPTEAARSPRGPPAVLTAFAPSSLSSSSPPLMLRPPSHDLPPRLAGSPSWSSGWASEPASSYLTVLSPLIISPDSSITFSERADSQTHGS